MLQVKLFWGKGKENLYQKNDAKRDSAGTVCNFGMGMLFLMYFILGGYVKYNLFGRGG